MTAERIFGAGGVPLLVTSVLARDSDGVPCLMVRVATSAPVRVMASAEDEEAQEARLGRVREGRG
jgi:hypothetical protein